MATSKGAKFVLLAVGLVIGFGAGFSVGWWQSPGPYRYFYQATDAIPIAASRYNADNVLPPGTVLVSDSKLRSLVDEGWWGYVPVYFMNHDIARHLSVTEGEEPDSILDFTLSAVVDFEAMDDPPPIDEDDVIVFDVRDPKP
ncbi:MAG: hypothetical protein AAF481_14490 [Acidobacteriota bacterium]